MGKKRQAIRQRRETGVDPRRKRRPLPLAGHPDDLPTEWNGERCEARRCLVIVGTDPERPEHWAKDIEGEQRRCVEIRVPIPSETFPDFRGVVPSSVYFEHGGALHPYPEGVTRPRGARVVVVLYLDDEPKQPRPDEVAYYAARAAAAAESEHENIREMAKTLEPTVGYHGWAWDKVTRGRGSPRYGHREVPVAKLLGYIDAPDAEPHIVEPELTES